jgi:hypothetical protein
MSDHRWSASEKKIARRAFDAALERALEKVVADFKARAATATTPAEVWDIGDELYKTRREIDRTFDYRYSQLPFVFARLILDGLLEPEQLAGLSEEKIEGIGKLVAWHRKLSSD